MSFSLSGDKAAVPANSVFLLAARCYASYYIADQIHYQKWDFKKYPTHRLFVPQPMYGRAINISRDGCKD